MDDIFSGCDENNMTTLTSSLQGGDLHHKLADAATWSHYYCDASDEQFLVGAGFKWSGCDVGHANRFMIVYEDVISTK